MNSWPDTPYLYEDIRIKYSVGRNCCFEHPHKHTHEENDPQNASSVIITTHYALLA